MKKVHPQTSFKYQDNETLERSEDESAAPPGKQTNVHPQKKIYLRKSFARRIVRMIFRMNEFFHRQVLYTDRSLFKGSFLIAFRSVCPPSRRKVHPQKGKYAFENHLPAGRPHVFHDRRAFFHPQSTLQPQPFQRILFDRIRIRLPVFRKKSSSPFFFLRQNRLLHCALL